MRLALRASQINQLQLTHYLTRLLRSVNLVNRKRKYAVGSTRVLVHLVRSHDFVLHALPKIIKGFLDGLALEDVHVFDCHLVCLHVPFELESLIFAKVLLSQGFLGLFVQ